MSNGDTEGLWLGISPLCGDQRRVTPTSWFVHGKEGRCAGPRSRRWKGTERREQNHLHSLLFHLLREGATHLSSLKAGQRYLHYHIFPYYVRYHRFMALWFCFLDGVNENSHKAIQRYCEHTHLEMKEHLSKFKMQTKKLSGKIFTFV